MMSIRTLLAVAVFCAPGFCQQRAANALGPQLAKPSDLSISCHIDALARSAQITIMNHSAMPVRLRVGGATIDYRAEIRSMAGKQLGVHDMKPPSQVRDASIAGTQIAPHAQYSEKVALRDLVDIPRAGGPFEVRIGRGLLPLANDPSQLDPHAIIWCKPIDVTFPPLR